VIFTPIMKAVSTFETVILYQSTWYCVPENNHISGRLIPVANLKSLSEVINVLG
jgi:hypothetical protein